MHILNLLYICKQKPIPTIMKRITLAILFALFALILPAQDDAIRVNYQGSKPSISDFAWAYLSVYNYDEDGDDCLDEARNAVKQAWINYRKGLPQDEGDNLTIDEKNGYVVYESKYDDDMVRIEMCYWNESDGKHKLFAYNVACFRNGRHDPGQFDGLLFYRYDNATRKMTYCDTPGFEDQYATEDGAWISYSLPRSGKDITVTTWLKDGSTQKKTLKWNGRRFTY